MSELRSISRALLVVHYHWRSGGVRRVVDAGVAELVRAGGFDRLILIGGEHSDDQWEAQLAMRIGDVPLTLIREPAVRYSSEQKLSPASMERRCRKALEFAMGLVDPRRSLLWVHNPGLARNVALGRAIRRVAGASGIRVVAHHHDFWFENRWARWPEMVAGGIRDLDEVAPLCFFPNTRSSQVTINSFDFDHLKLPAKAWVPNPVAFCRRPSDAAVRSAREWLVRRVGEDRPVWLSATRLLRRKNLAEGLLLTRWLRPDACFVTTAGPSSRDEESYGRRLMEAAARNEWPARFGLLAGLGGRHPSIEELQCAAETVMLTSVQEGFGLAFLEAACLGVPLIARRLANVQPDLDRLGIRIPHLYSDVRIPVTLFDRRREQRGREKIWKAWKSRLPAACRKDVATCPEVNARTEPFSRLTLDSQLEVLAQDPAQAYAEAQPENPWMQSAKRLRPAAWPGVAAGLIGPESFARGILELAAAESDSFVERTAVSAQRELVRQRLGAGFLYPILMQ